MQDFQYSMVNLFIDSGMGNMHPLYYLWFVLALVLSIKYRSCTGEANNVGMVYNEQLQALIHKLLTYMQLAMSD